MKVPSYKKRRETSENHFKLKAEYQ